MEREKAEVNQSNKMNKLQATTQKQNFGLKLQTLDIVDLEHIILEVSLLFLLQQQCNLGPGISWMHQRHSFELAPGKVIHIRQI